MVIACDTSFLFSLYGSDVHSPRAVVWVAKNTVALYFNSLTHFEFGNAVRFSEFRKAIPVGSAAQYLAGFEAAIAQGRLIVVTSNLADVVDEAKRLSSMCRGAIKPGRFVALKAGQRRGAPCEPAQRCELLGAGTQDTALLESNRSGVSVQG